LEHALRRPITADELAVLFHDIGACIWNMQYLEDALHTFLALKIDIRLPGAVAEQEEKNFLAKHRRGTLGTSLRTAKANSALPASLLKALEELKDERDWLVHRSWNEDGDGLYTDEGRTYVFERIRGIEQRTKNLKAEIVRELQQFCTASGVSDSQAEALAVKQVRALRGEG
jgi:hypothetical protein